MSLLHSLSQAASDCFRAAFGKRCFLSIPTRGYPRPVHRQRQPHGGDSPSFSPVARPQISTLRADHGSNPFPSRLEGPDSAEMHRGPATYRLIGSASEVPRYHCSRTTTYDTEMARHARPLPRRPGRIAQVLVHRLAGGAPVRIIFGLHSPYFAAPLIFATVVIKGVSLGDSVGHSE
jgi:hypothetical protein